MAILDPGAIAPPIVTDSDIQEISMELLPPAS